MQETLLVIQIDGCRDFGEVLDGFRGCFEESLCDNGGVHALLQHLLGCSEEASSKNYDGCRPISSLNVLGCRQIDQLI